MPRRPSGKTKLTLWVDKNLIASAKEIGLNLSAFLEIKLREYLMMEIEPRPGFEPGTFALPRQRSAS